MTANKTKIEKRRLIRPYGLGRILYIWLGQTLALAAVVLVAVSILEGLGWDFTTREIRLVVLALALEFTITFYRWWKRRMAWCRREAELLERINELEGERGAPEADY